MAHFHATDMPIVLLDSAYPGVSGVEVDHRGGAYQSVGYLASLGHRRIALVDRPHDPFVKNPISERLDGYVEARRDFGLAVVDDYLIMGNYSLASGRTAAARLLSLPQPPTAIITGSDLQALGVLEAARERGLGVPEDLSVVGYHDIQLSAYVGLTTVRLPTADLGRMAVEMLTEQLSEHAVGPVQRRVTGELIVRGSSGPVPRVVNSAD